MHKEHDDGHTMLPPVEFSLSIVDRWRSRQDVVRSLFQWTRSLALFIAFLYLIAFLRQPGPSTLILFITLSLFMLISWWCLIMLRQGRIEGATRIYLGSTTTVIALFMLFMPSSLILVGMIGLLILVRITALLETWSVTILFGAGSIILYLMITIWRHNVQFFSGDVWLLEDIFLYLAPVAVLLIFALIDRISTQYLRQALKRSEVARHDLARSYRELEQQKKAVEKSEITLSMLAKKLERSNLELHTSNEEMKSFAYIVSHDLRAPLINLKGFASELRYALEALQPAVNAASLHLEENQKLSVTRAYTEDVPEALSFIDASVTLMDHFITAILELSRMGRRDLHPERLDMDALVQTTLKTLAHQIEQRQVEVILAPLPKVVADRLSMKQIIGNMLTNAIIYLDPDRPGRVEITAESNSEEITFHISDNGRGIAADDMSKVFELFRRAGKHDTPGEGMGLAYVQALVRRHGGRIWCQSELGVGTTFSFTIPFEKFSNNGKHEKI